MREVVYVEPYPKSKAQELHGDDIAVGSAELSTGKRLVLFRPFQGVGPRRYMDLFSPRIGDGVAIDRKDPSGVVRRFDHERATPRVPMQPTTYMEREKHAFSLLKSAIGKEGA